MTVCKDMLKAILVHIIAFLDKAIPMPVDEAKTTDHISLCRAEVTDHILKDIGKC